MTFIRWESSSFGASPLSGTLPIIAVGQWSASLGAFSGSITDASQLTKVYYKIGDTDTSALLSIQSGSAIIAWNRDTTLLPGILDALEEDSNFGLRIQFTNISFAYAIISSSLNRQGIFVNQSTGSPQLSLEAVRVNPTESWAGDIWYLNTGSYDGENGYRFNDENKSNNAIFTSKPLFSRLGEDSSSVITRYSTVDGPKNMHVAVSSVIGNDWFVTVNSASVNGKGWQNASWGGGIYMPDSNSVAIYGNKNFLVPSGNVIISGTIQAAQYIGSITSASYAGTASILLGSIVSASYALTASYAANGSGGTTNFSTGSYTGSFTGSLLGTASYATSATTLTPRYTISSSLLISPVYQSISSGSQHLSTGMYLFSLMANDGQHINELYTGQLSWYQGLTNSTGSDEVSMHRMGQSPGSMSLYMHTRRQTGNQIGFLELASNIPDIVTGSYNLSLVKIF